MQFKHLTEAELLEEIHDLQIITDKWECLREYSNRKLLNMVKKAESLDYLKGYSKAIEEILGTKE